MHILKTRIQETSDRNNIFLITLFFKFSPTDYFVWEPDTFIVIIQKVVLLYYRFIFHHRLHEQLFLLVDKISQTSVKPIICFEFNISGALASGNEITIHMASSKVLNQCHLVKMVKLDNHKQFSTSIIRQIAP